MTGLKQPARSRLQIPRGSVGPFIHDLARRHGVTYIETPSDRQCDDFARLSDSEVVLDDAENLITALRRAGVISSDEHAELHDAYIRNDLGLH